MKIHSAAALNQYRRSTGFNCPWHPYQLFSYFLTIFYIINFSLTIIPTYHSSSRAILITTFTVLLFAFCYHGFLLTISNPTDSQVIQFRSQLSQNKPQPMDIITKTWCELCKSVTASSSKHCTRCNRCVSNFDHHCKFVNNCVGDKNYRTFLRLIIILEIFIIWIVCVSAKFSLERKIEIVHLSVYIQIVLSVVILGFNGYLIGFHLFLCKKKLTTYEYFIRKNSNWKETEFKSQEKASSSIDNP